MRSPGFSSGEIDTDSILVVDSEAGETRIGRADEAARHMLSQRLYTPGELLRMRQLGFEDFDPDFASQESEPAHAG